ncbi:DUF6415 family natural product biosynthesis protein [Streptomyces sp. NPDC006435]|uniref:DUF6415 family natural product biosynthesis protein n=1 Tax=Streptomyces sp. NPDC006435 TaxID=3154300 RepID=UPI0033B6AEF0
MSAVPDAPPTTADMARDADLALVLAQGRPVGPASGEVRKRLRSHIGLLVDPAEEYAKDLTDPRARDIASGTVEHARGLLRDQDGDPAAMLRLLGKAVHHLLRYASHVQRHERRT